MRYVLITGASGVIGSALVAAFGNAGDLVVGLDIAPASTVLARHVQADLDRMVVDPAYREVVVAELSALTDGSGYSVIVNNAAAQQLGPFETLSDSTWHRTINVNVLAPVMLVRSFFDDLVRNAGCVVNISSIHAQLTKPGFSAYATSKAALSGLTRALAVECGGKFRVNAIAPAAVDTPMLRDGFGGNLDDLSKLARFHPTQGIGTPAEVAAVTVALSSPSMAFMNGAVVGLDGGISARLHDPA